MCLPKHIISNLNSYERWLDVDWSLPCCMRQPKCMSRVSTTVFGSSSVVNLEGKTLDLVRSRLMHQNVADDMNKIVITASHVLSLNPLM